jgi:hypothetical protein
MSVPSQNARSKELDWLFARLIGIQERVDPETITPLWIHEQREKRFTHLSVIVQTYGTISYTRDELRQLDEAVDKMLASC